MLQYFDYIQDEPFQSPKSPPTAHRYYISKPEFEHTHLALEADPLATLPDPTRPTLRIV